VQVLGETLYDLVLGEDLELVLQDGLLEHGYLVVQVLI